MLSQQPTYRHRTILERIAGAALAVALAALLSIVFRGLIERVVFIFFFAALAFTSWFSGFIAALFVVVFGVVFVNYYLIPPFDHIHFDVSTIFTTVTFAAVAFFMSWLADKMRIAADVASARAKQLEEQAIELE